MKACGHLCLLIMIMTLLGCATGNPLVTYYQDFTTDIPPDVIVARFEPPSENPKIVTSSDYENDLYALLQQGYLTIGLSEFTWSGTPSVRQIEKRAKEVQADVVLYSSAYSHTESGTRTMVGMVPGSSTTVSSFGQVNANTYGSSSASVYASDGYAYGSGTYTGRGSAYYSGTDTITTDPEFYTYNVPYSYQVNSYAVSFLRKGKQPVFGARVVPLPDEMRLELKRNTGLLVWLVENDTPAFRANILPGDVIIGLNEDEVTSIDAWNFLINENRGKEEVVKILRDGVAMDFKVRFND